MTCEYCKMRIAGCRHVDTALIFECPIAVKINELQELIDKRDAMNASDRGKVLYDCHDLFYDRRGIEDCLYGTDDESDCKHLKEGKHPSTCSSAIKKEAGE